MITPAEAFWVGRLEAELETIRRYKLIINDRRVGLPSVPDLGRRAGRVGLRGVQDRHDPLVEALGQDG